MSLYYPRTCHIIYSLLNGPFDPSFF